MWTKWSLKRSFGELKGSRSSDDVFNYNSTMHNGHEKEFSDGAPVGGWEFIYEFYCPWCFPRQA